jgi:hypothetical protein
MTTRIQSRCDAKEVNSISSNILFNLKKKDWSTNNFLTGIITRVESKDSYLNNSIGEVKSNRNTAILAEADRIFDQDIVCLKSFIEANKYLRDETLVKHAEDIWEMIAAHDANLHRLGYEKQIVLADSLLIDFDKVDVKSVIATLTGVPEAIVNVKLSLANLKALYRESKEYDAAKADVLAPSIQKNEICDIINQELIPYLDVMSKVEPDVYKESYMVILEYIESINTKVKARISRSNKQDDLVAEVE